MYSPSQSPNNVTSAKFKVKALPQASVAVAVANTAGAGQLIVTGAGNANITGACISITCIVWVAEEAFPQSSMAVQVLVILYSPVHSPLEVTSVKVRSKSLLQLSIAEATAKTGVSGQVMVVVAGNTAMTGAVTSMTWIVCAAVDTFPHASVAVQVLVTLYSPAQSPPIV